MLTGNRRSTGILSAEGIYWGQRRDLQGDVCSRGKPSARQESKEGDVCLRGEEAVRRRTTRLC